MIQRIQTLFLFLIVVSMGSVLGTNIWSKTDIATDQQVRLTAFELSTYKANAVASTQATYLIAVFAIVAALLAIVSITQYKTRVRQMLIGIFTSFALAATIGASFYYVYRVGETMLTPDKAGNYGIGFFAAVVGLFCNMLANRFIRRDEDLVRSANRMR